MKYVVVWNKALAQRKEWLVLGGASREAVNRTGIFHTGAKKALVAFHLMGLEVVVASSDDRGEYFYSVDSKDTEIGPIVMGEFRTPEGAIELVETTYTTAIANNAWLEGFNGNRYVRAFGQFLLNAVGTSPDSWGILMNQEEPEVVEGTTRVYVPQTIMMEALLEDLEQYFAWAQIPIAEMPLGQADGSIITVQVMRRPDNLPASTIVYHTGLLAYCEGAIQRPFKYAYNIMDDKTGAYLSEERHIRSISKVRVLIGNAYERAIRDGNLKAIDCILESLQDGEGQLYIWATHPLLAEAFFAKFGRRACIAAENMVVFVADKVDRPVVGIASSALVHALQASGVDKATDSEHIRNSRVERELGKRQRKLIQADVDLLIRAGLASGDSVEFHQFTNVDPTDSTAGTWDPDSHTIGIRTDMLQSQRHRLVVLVHEFRHMTSRANDYDREFSNQADRDIVRLLLALLDGRNIDDVADES